MLYLHLLPKNASKLLKKENKVNNGFCCLYI